MNYVSGQTWAARGALSWALFAITACAPPEQRELVDGPTIAPDQCVRWQEGCACDPGSAPVHCDKEIGREGPVVTCGSGMRACREGVWSTCDVNERRTVITGQALSSGAVQCSPCEPACATVQNFPTSEDEIEGDGFNVSVDPNGGIILTQQAPANGSTCVGGNGAGCTGFNLNGDATGLPSSGVSLNPDGSLVLTNPNSTIDGALLGSLFISNTGEGTVSRFDFKTFKETGRWWTCPLMNASCDPSRTSLNTRGDAFIANRTHHSIVRISNLGSFCPDTNKDGKITTSTNGTPLPWGQDDCVLWYKDLGSVGVDSMLRGVAAQDLTDNTTGELKEYVWAGGHNSDKAHRTIAGYNSFHPSTASIAHDNSVVLLDGANGNMLAVTTIASGCYGMALDRAQNLWMIEKSRTSRGLMRIDTTRCGANAVCPTASFTCESGAGFTTNCDTAVKEVITLPSAGYGLTVDFNQRVWFNGSKVGSYDKRKAIGSRFTLSAGASGNAGVAADSKGWTWACTGASLLRLSSERPDIAANTVEIKDSLGASIRCKGVGVDTVGKIWAIPL